jgi:hypothetical protein
MGAQTRSILERVCAPIPCKVTVYFNIKLNKPEKDIFNIYLIYLFVFTVKNEAYSRHNKDEEFVQNLSQKT